MFSRFMRNRKDFVVKENKIGRDSEGDDPVCIIGIGVGE